MQGIKPFDTENSSGNEDASEDDVDDANEKKEFTRVTNDTVASGEHPPKFDFFFFFFKFIYSVGIISILKAIIIIRFNQTQ